MLVQRLSPRVLCKGDANSNINGKRNGTGIGNGLPARQVPYARAVCYLCSDVRSSSNAMIALQVGLAYQGLRLSFSRLDRHAIL